MSYTDVATRVTLLGEFTSEEIIEFSTEDTICDKLLPFADLNGHFEARRIVQEVNNLVDLIRPLRFIARKQPAEFVHFLTLIPILIRGRTWRSCSWYDHDEGV